MSETPSSEEQPRSEDQARPDRSDSGGQRAGQSGGRSGSGSSGSRRREHGGRGERGRRGGRRRRSRPTEREGSGETTAVEIEGPLVHVAFRGARREAFQNPKGLELRPGDYVLVEADRGTDLGWVITPAGPELKRKKSQPIRSLIRHATREEIARLDVLAQEDHEAHEICRGRAEHFELDMKVIDAETQFDSNRVTFYFTADRRVDFRELVRDLARIFRTRIELRQVGARDAARRCDGIGPCGRRLCCTSFLREFEPVTLKMAKQQNLALNPAKISGSCGRLMCCLTYEVGAYLDALREAPEIGSRWHFRSAIWEIDRLDIGNHRIFLKDGDGQVVPVDLEEFRAGAILEPDGGREPAGEETLPPEAAAEPVREADERSG